MRTKLSLVGNLTSNVEEKTTSKGAKLFKFTVAVNLNKEETNFYTCFYYGELNVKNFTQGSLIFVYGNNKETLETKPTIGEIYINRVVNVIDVELLFSKKTE